MALAAHRKAPNRDRELRERAWALAERRLAGRIICAKCKATAASYPTRCQAEGGDKCPGDKIWEETFAAALRGVSEQ